jgi:uncharacterized protein (DUF3820 family)
MYYEVFPFGKYKGVKLKDLPSTYIVLVLEQFELPIELKDELGKILLGRIYLYSQMKDIFLTKSKSDFLDFINERINTYE